MTETVGPGAGTAPVLRDAADRASAELRDYLAPHGWTDAETAATLLNVTHPTLLDLITGGDLDGVVLGGRAWVNGSALQLRVIEHVQMGASRARESRALARTALRAYLAARPVVGHWDAAREHGRPLICRRRGKASTWLRHGLAFHTVTLNTRWLSRWVYAEGMAAAPELTALPVGPHLRALLVDLAGVEPVGSVTPLFGDARAHTVSGWIKVDTSAWTVVVPDEVEQAIAAPPSPLDDER